MPVEQFENISRLFSPIGYFPKALYD